MPVLLAPQETVPVGTCVASHASPDTATPDKATPDKATPDKATPDKATEPCDGRAPTRVERTCRRLIFDRLKLLTTGRLSIVDTEGTYEFGKQVADGYSAVMFVQDPYFYQRLVFGGSLAAEESYIQREWDTPDLVAAMRVLARHTDVLRSMDRGGARLLRPLRAGWNWLRRNTRSGSRRNISAHYDLGNDFFGLMLDPTMTYSSALFSNPESTLEEASIEKYDRICKELGVCESDHLIEVGCGWGGFALHAAQHYGCRVTTTTISAEQYQFARARIDAAKMGGQINLLLQDYRDLDGEYDKLVSIEMIEAVGERYLETYFGKCSDLLKPDGAMMLQAIIIPDYRYDDYRKSVDFIQRYIFPGGFLPSVSAIGQSMRKATDLRLLGQEDFGLHYAETLSRWRDNFWNRIDQVKGLGFDDRFIRTWNYYLCYCEAGFEERQIGVSQLLFAKPRSKQQALKLYRS